MHCFVYLLLELLSLSPCVIAAPRSLSGPTGADQSIQAIAEEATYAFAPRTVIRSAASPNLTGQEERATGQTTLLASSLNAEATPKCLDPRPQPPSFRCIEALHEFLRSFDQSKSYIIERFRFPTPFPYASYVVPRTFIAGTCRLTIDVNHRVFDPGRVSGQELKNWSSDLINKCVSNERYSGGGFIEIGFGQMGHDFVNLFIYVRSTVIDARTPATNVTMNANTYN